MRRRGRVGLAVIVGAVLAAGWASAGAATAAGSPARWSAPSKVPGIGMLRAVSCATPDFCMAVGGRQAVVYRSGSWRRPWTIDRHGSLNLGLLTVSCVATSFCAAGDGAGRVFLYDGTRWSAPRLVAGAGLAQLSCATRSFCGALDIRGEVAFYDGHSWSSPRRLAPASQPSLISCPLAGFCLALDFTQAYRLSGRSWLAAGSINPSPPPEGSEPDVASALSCPGRRFCASLDDFGDAFTWTGGRWSRAHRFDPTLLAGTDAVSCATRTSCQAVDGNGYESRWNGRRWSPRRRIDPAAALLAAVSCPTAHFCLAVDFRGRALIYR